MAEKTTHVRLKQETFNRLLAECAKQERLYTEGGKAICTPDDRWGVTIDQLINALLDGKNAHRARAKKSASKAKGPTEVHQGPTEQG